MPARYTPKKKYLDDERVDKLIKDTISNSNEDRKLALSVFEIFKGKYELGTDDFAKTDMINSLQLMQESTGNIVKLIELGIKLKIEDQRLEVKENKDEKNTTFEALENIQNETQEQENETP